MSNKDSISYIIHIEKNYKEYKIKLSSKNDIINIQIKNNYSIYESNFNLEYLHNYRLLVSNYTIN